MSGCPEVNESEESKVEATVSFMTYTRREFQGAGSMGANLKVGYWSSLPFCLIEIFIEKIIDLYAVLTIQRDPVHMLPSFLQSYPFSKL